MAAIKLSRHARERMAERDVTWQEIEDVVNGPPAQVTYDLEQNSYRLERTLKRGRLKVWVVPPWPPRYPEASVVIKSAAWKGR